MNDEKTPDDFEEFDDYTKEQMVLIANELNDLQLKYDTRLFAALLAGRSALLHANLVTAKVMTQEEALGIWDYAGKMIKNMEDREIKVMKMMDGTIFDPDKTN
ncbi:MAG: hypothetical protein ACXADH_10720 [Candidatus Kariarchaeaceae archaeon]|jgi:hypothetical protein